MPTPAGTGVDRRRFLVAGAGGLVTVFGAGRLGFTDRVLSEGIAQAATGGPRSPVLISIFLAGGVDSLSLLAPVADPVYQKLRPTLALSPDAGLPFSEDPRLHWHPAASALAALHDAGKLTAMPGIGYRDPDMSHFTSRHYWEVGATSTSLETGWMGRYLDLAGTPQNPLQGLSLDGQMHPALATARNPVAAMGTPESFSLWLENVWGEIFDLALDSAAQLGRNQLASIDPGLAQAAQAAAEVGVVRQALAPFRNADGQPTYHSPVAYPKSASSDFPQRLAGLAAMLSAGLPIRCVALSSDSQFDTHSGQAKTFERDLTLITDSVAAFQADLEARGLADRVLTHLWSEFGRRAEENGSGGTDHGAGGASVLVGTRVSGKMVGEWPGLASLDGNGNLRSNVDFRGVYCSLLESWFGHDAASVVPGAAGLPRYALLR